ncbi:MAG: helix-turn-helix transcriptional regulator [Candidatus Bathyarchaeota archaeon]
MRTDDLKKAILLMLRNNELYGYDINRRLAQQDMSSNISRLYGILNEMQKDRLLMDRWERSKEGPRKKMYSLTDKGREALNEILLAAISTVHLFYGDYLRSLFPKVDVFGNILNVLTEGMEQGDNLGYLSDSFSGINQVLLKSLQAKNPSGKLYLIKPGNLDLRTDLENANVFDGTYNDLPFKDDFIDRLIVIGVPTPETLVESTKEWRRVIKEGGRLTIVTPTILIQEHEEPMTIGDYVEKHEHQVIEKGSLIDHELFMSSLRDNFSEVVEREATHMTLITANSE